jgi:transposase
MPKPLLTDELWAVIEPLLPKERPKPKGGRPRVNDRAALTGILFVLKTGIPWEMLPKEMGCGSGMTCWRRLKEWHEAGVWRRLHRVLLDRLGKADHIDWSRASLDSASVPAPGGAKKPGRIRRIAANRARNAISWSTKEAFHSRWGILRPIPMTPLCSRRWWTPSNRSGDPEADRESVLRSSEAARRQGLRRQEVPKCTT